MEKITEPKKKYRYNTGDTITFRLDESSFDLARFKVKPASEYADSADRFSRFRFVSEEAAPYLSRNYEIDKSFRTTWQHAPDKARRNQPFNPKRKSAYRKTIGKNIYNIKYPFTKLCQMFLEDSLIYLGVNRYSRKAIVVDIDRPWPYEKNLSKITFDEQAQCICDWAKNALGIIPSHVILNTRPNDEGRVTYHFQLHFDLADYFLVEDLGDLEIIMYDGSPVEEKQGYEYVTAVFNAALDGDPKFNGGWAKNPYCENGWLWVYHTGCIYEAKQLKEIAGSIDCVLEEWERDHKKNPEVFIEYENVDPSDTSPKRVEVIDILEAPSFFVTGLDSGEICQDCQELASKKSEEKVTRGIKKHKKKVERVIRGLASSSRNVYTFDNLKIVAWELMREREAAGESVLLTKQDLFDLAVMLQYESLAITGKTQIEPARQIWSMVNGSFDWIVNHFNSTGKSRSKYSDIQRALAVEAKKVDKAINVLRYRSLRKQGLKKKDIARYMEVTQNSITAYDKADIEEAIEILQEYYKKHKNSKLEIINNRIFTIKELLITFNAFFFEENEEIEISEILLNKEIAKDVAEKISAKYNKDVDERLYKLVEYFKRRSLLVSQGIRSWPNVEEKVRAG